LQDPSAVAAMVKSLPENIKVGLLFGPEDHGLSNRELKLCRWLIQIPTSRKYPSMNLSHAVAVILFELNRQKTTHHNNEYFTQASVSQVEAFYDHLKEMLLDIGFLHVDNPERIMYPLRRLFARSGLSTREVTILRGIVRQAHWALKQVNLKFRR